jgi:hypothetical protein
MTVRLTDLNPEWIDGKPGSPDRMGVGISFDCPCGCCADRCSIPFRNPLDGRSTINALIPSWIRVGTTFETLTLTPSILRSTPSGCSWHGNIVNGEVIEW